MSLEFKAVRTESAASQIAGQIRDSIVSGNLKVDQRLPTEEELAQQFNVSRPTVREALKILGAQNLIRSRRGSSGGTFVRLPDNRDIREQLSSITSVLVSMGEFSMQDIIEARSELEQICCSIAAIKRSPDDLLELAKELDYQRNADITDIEFCASDVRFHTLLAQATQNSVLKFLMLAVSEILQPVLNMVVFRFRERQLILSHHENIVAALTDRNAQGAVNALVEQMTYLTSKYQQAQAWREERDAKQNFEEERSNSSDLPLSISSTRS